MKELQRWAMPACALVAAGALITACGTANGGTNASAQGQAGNAVGQDPSADPSADPGEGADGAATDGAATDTTTTSLEAANDAKLGQILVDVQGRTVYRFDKDTPNPPQSNCVDDCAKTWPALTAGQDDVAVKGVDAKLLGKIQRGDGTEQLTLAGWPLYLYAKDTVPGDAKGQGVGDTWFVSTPTGKKASAKQQQQPSAAGQWKGKLVLRVRNDPNLGPVVEDGEGNTLYRFDKDRVKPTISNCLGQCAKTWPPVKFTSKMKLTGINKAQLSNIMRKDGICQVALNGRPLYRFAKDLKPGDAKGQGVGNTWFVSDPQGRKALGSGGAGDGAGSGAGTGSGY